MSYFYDPSTIIFLIVPPCIMLLVSIALWSFARSEMRRSLPMRMYASVVALTGLGFAVTALCMLTGNFGWESIAYQVVLVAFVVSSLRVLLRIWSPVARTSTVRRSLRPTLRIRPRKVRTYKNPKGRKPNRGRTPFAKGSTFRIRRC